MLCRHRLIREPRHARPVLGRFRVSGCGPQPVRNVMSNRIAQQQNAERKKKMRGRFFNGGPPEVVAVVLGCTKSVT
jgi:hypothetical protein